MEIFSLAVQCLALQDIHTRTHTPTTNFHPGLLSLSPSAKGNYQPTGILFPKDTQKPSREAQSEGGWQRCSPRRASLLPDPRPCASAPFLRKPPGLLHSLFLILAAGEMPVLPELPTALGDSCLTAATWAQAARKRLR